MEHGCDSQLVIGGDGTVLVATGQLPSGLVDIHLDECENLSPEIREAGHTLLHQLRQSGTRAVTQVIPVGPGDRAVQLVAIDALAIRRSATDIRTLLTSKLSVISSQAAAADVALTLVVDPGVPDIVHLDADKVAWAVTTLVGNALRYLQAGSRRMPGKTIDVRTTFDAPRSHIVIEVQDNGPGVPADTVARLFRHDGLNVRGAGLALLLIADVCAAHGGNIDVRSSTDASGHGTTIQMTFAAR